MSDTEAIYYYIRNAFAYGAFQVVNGKQRVYILESIKDNKIKARMRLKEEMLFRLLDLSKLTADERRNLKKTLKIKKDKKVK